MDIAYDISINQNMQICFRTTFQELSLEQKCALHLWATAGAAARAGQWWCAPLTLRAAAVCYGHHSEQH